MYKFFFKYYFQTVLTKMARIGIRIQGLLDLDPDCDFWLDPDSIEYGSETLSAMRFSDSSL